MPALQIKNELLNALIRLSSITQGRCEVLDLAGKRNADIRQDIMSGIAGGRVTKAKSGVNAIKSALVSIFNPSGCCQAQIDDDLQGCIRESITRSTMF